MSLSLRVPPSTDCRILYAPQGWVPLGKLGGRVPLEQGRFTQEFSLIPQRLSGEAMALPLVELAFMSPSEGPGEICPREEAVHTVNLHRASSPLVHPHTSLPRARAVEYTA